MNEAQISRGMRDGVEIHKAALQTGFDTRLLPRQVLQVVRNGAVTSFTHGIPQGSTLSGVTFTQDLRMRRGLLGKAGIPQPKGATFSIGKKRAPIRRYARQIGFPVVLKPALGDSTIDVVRGIGSSKKLVRALNALLVPPDQRPGSTRAAYGITELRAPGRHKGRITVPPGYRVLVEEEIEGQYIRLLVLGGTIIHAVDLDSDPWGENHEELSLAQLPDEVHTTVAETVGSLPGLDVLAVDIVLRNGTDAKHDHRRHDDDGEVEVPSSATVVDVSERPWLEVQHRISPELSNRLAQEIVRFAAGAATLDAPRLGTMSVDIDFEGIVAPEEFVAALTNYAADQHFELSLDVRDRALGYVGGRLEATSHDIAGLAETVLEQGIEGQTAMKAEITQ